MLTLSNSVGIINTQCTAEKRQCLATHYGTEQRHGNRRLKRHLRKTDIGRESESIAHSKAMNERMDRVTMCPRKRRRKEDKGSYDLNAECNCHPRGFAVEHEAIITALGLRAG